MTTWFTADTHFGHTRIIELCGRPFRDVDHMNEEIVDRFNSVIKPNDVLYILGDIALGQINDSLQWVALINGQKALVPGNHDRVWTGHPKKGKPVKPEDIARYEAAGLTLMAEQTRFYRSSYDENYWTLCHFPDQGDSHDADRYDAWRPPAPSWVRPLIHGHVHGKWRVNGPRINVGVDVWNFRPVSEAELQEIVDGQLSESDIP